jgi:hypothetical protein
MKSDQDAKNGLGGEDKPANQSPKQNSNTVLEDKKRKLEDVDEHGKEETNAVVLAKQKEERDTMGEIKHEKHRRGCPGRAPTPQPTTTAR